MDLPSLRLRQAHRAQRKFTLGPGKVAPMPLTSIALLFLSKLAIFRNSLSIFLSSEMNARWIFVFFFLVASAIGRAASLLIPHG